MYRAIIALALQVVDVEIIIFDCDDGIESTNYRENISTRSSTVLWVCFSLGRLLVGPTQQQHHDDGDHEIVGLRSFTCT
jgi:hypothetical protein